MRKYRIKNPFKLISVIIVIVLIAIMFIKKDDMRMHAWILAGVINIRVVLYISGGSWRKIFLSFVFAVVLTGAYNNLKYYYDKNTYIYGALVKQDDAKEIIFYVEKVSLYPAFVENGEYKKYKDELLKKDEITKDDMKKYMGVAYKYSGNRAMRFSYIDSMKQLTQKGDSNNKKISSGVTDKVSDKNLLHINLKHFEDGTTEQVRKLMADNVSNTDGLILDLRGNLGGAVDVMVDIAEIFLPVGTEICTQYNRNYRTTYYTQKRDEYNKNIL